MEMLLGDLAFAVFLLAQVAAVHAIRQSQAHEEIRHGRGAGDRRQFDAGDQFIDVASQSHAQPHIAHVLGVN
jgi:hypothetical protein